MIEQKFEIENTPDKGWVLWIDNKPSTCPFQPMLFGQTPMGQSVPVRLPCSTQCALARLEEDIHSGSTEKSINYTTYCGGGKTSREVVEKESPKQPQSGLLKTL